MKLVISVASLFVVVTACTTSQSAAPHAPRVMTHEEAEAEKAGAHEGEPGESEADERHEQESAAKTRDVVDADGVVRRGQALSAMEATPVSTAIAKAAELEGKHVKLAGTVNSVCAKAG